MQHNSQFAAPRRKLLTIFQIPDNQCHFGPIQYTPGALHKTITKCTITQHPPQHTDIIQHDTQHNTTHHKKHSTDRSQNLHTDRNPTKATEIQTLAYITLPSSGQVTETSPQNQHIKPRTTPQHNHTTHHSTATLHMHQHGTANHPQLHTQPQHTRTHARTHTHTATRRHRTATHSTVTSNTMQCRQQISRDRSHRKNRPRETDSNQCLHPTHTNYPCTHQERRTNATDTADTPANVND